MGRGRLSAYSPHHPDVIQVAPEFNRDPEEVRSSRISALYREAKHPVKVKDIVGPTQSLREAILRVSLFPNIYNRSTVLSSD